MGDAIAYDAGSDRVMVFAIVAPGDSLATQNETWAYDPVRDEWSLVGVEQPRGLHGARATYDAESDRIVLFGGSGETWSYDADADRWHEMTPTVSPPGRTWHGMAYDADADLIVLYGGFALDGLNQYAIRVGGVGLFTPDWGAATRKRSTCGTDTNRNAPCSEDTLEVTVTDGVVSRITTEPGEGAIPPGTVVLVGREAG